MKRGYTWEYYLPPDLRAEYLLAKKVVRLLPEAPPAPSDVWRCHEVARIAHVFLTPSSWEVVDGKYGPVNHSWLQTTHPAARWILDVYSVGREPMVAIVDGSPLAGVGALYRRVDPGIRVRGADVRQGITKVNERWGA